MSDASVSPIDTHLYPDLAEQGGLGPAWRNAARRAGVDLEEISWPDDFFRLNYASVATASGRIDLATAANRRVFSMNVSVDGRPRLWGGSDDLELLARAAAAWRDGSTIREMIAAFPFLETSRFEQAREDGNLLDVLWEFHLGDPGYETMRPVLRAAHDDPRLSRLYPSVTHETLARFTVDPDDRENGQVAIWHHAGRYEVETSWQATTRPAATPAEAVRLASAEIPDTY
ncbi:DUF6193 family natural product biosynthesis protein [Actinoplanes sp. NPDC048796]|uniref:DUF6193 family natural product biosynthesis protein n=1 Tax=Actinoplanes sp. NPDC048796 TaxID=3155640 RepID=UPI003401DB46